MEKTYCIFTVFDYNGGKLSSDVNLSKEELLGNLISYFESCFYENSSTTLKEIKDTIDEYLKEDFYSTYAGGDGFCGEIYEVEGSVVKQIYIEDLADEIAVYIFNKWYSEAEEEYTGKVCGDEDTGCDLNCMECEVPTITPEDCEDCRAEAEESGFEYEANFTHVTGCWTCEHCRRGV